MVPAADICESHLYADIRFDQLRDLSHAVAEASARIVCSGGGLVRSLLDRLQQRHRIERLAPGSIQDLVACPGIHGLKDLRSACIPNREVVQILDGDRILRAPQRARQRGSQAHGPHGRGFSGLDGEGAIQPPTGCTFQTRRARLHIILSVEVRSRRIGRARGVNDRKPPLLPQGF